jgi:adenylate cyclase
MDELYPADGFLFGDFLLDRGGLFRRDQTGIFSPVKIGSRAFDLLRMLVCRPGELVSKDALVAAVWPGTVVEESNLPAQIRTLRGILDKPKARSGSSIQTVAGRGYRFAAAVTRRPADLHSANAPNEIGAGPVPRLSIVVLPFTNLSDDREQQYFADGITEDVTTDLSRIPNMFVISRNTAFTYRNRPVTAKQIGCELGVRYVLEGSVRRSGTTTRVNVELIDAETDGHVWAEPFDGDGSDLLALQNEITSRVADSLNRELIRVEAARSLRQPDALDYIFRGRAENSNPPTRKRYAKQIFLFEQALEIDPLSVEAQSHLAGVLAARVLDQMADSAALDLERAEELAERAVAASPRSALAHYAKAQVLRARGRPEEAIPEYETVLSINRNWLFVISILGWCKFWTGSVDEAIGFFQQAIRLNPRDLNMVGLTYFRIGLVDIAKSRTEEAVRWLEKARSLIPEHPNARAALASAYALEGEIDRAAAELAEARRLVGDDRYSSVARLKATGYFGIPGYFGAPKTRALLELTYFAGLRKAGMPDSD